MEARPPAHLPRADLAPDAAQAHGPVAPTADDGIEDHDRGLEFDLPRLVGRRRALALLGGGLGLGLLAACSSDDASDDGSTGGADGGSGTAATPTTVEAADVSEIADETAGPFPADGSNGPDVLAASGVVREDIRTSFGDLSGTADGVEVAIEMTLLDVAAGGTPLAGAAVYAWHCTADGRYSLYESPVEDQNYLRGVQESDADGVVRFTTVFPGCYPGRWPHIHFEVYDSLDTATSAGSKMKTSQLALPQDACEEIYADAAYGESAGNLGQLSIDTDGIFRDGYASQLATVAGTAGTDLRITLNVGV